MLFPTTKKIAIENNWHRTSNKVFGLYKDYFFTVGDSSLLNSPTYKYLTAKADHFTTTQKAEISKALSQNKSELKFSQFEFQGDQYLSVVYYETAGFVKISGLYHMLDFLSGLFSSLGLEKMLKCHQSGAVNDLNYYIINEEGMILSKDVAAKLETDLEDSKHKQAIENKNYFGGFLGSVLFSLPAIVLWVFIAVYFSKLASGIALLIGFLGLKGYNYFKGRIGNYTPYIIIFSNVLCILIANYITVIYLVFQQSNDLSYALQEFNSNPEVKKYFTSNLLVSMILAVIVWLWLFIQLRPAKIGVKLAEEVK